jgi:cell division septation protein DedD
MRNKETGEFELVVGDRQLLSGFFIGVLLLAVVFAMGYVLGQNSPRSTKVVADAVATNTGAPNRPMPASPAEHKADTTASTPATGDAAGGAATTPATAAADAPPQPTTQPAHEPSAPVATPPPAPAPAAAETEPPNASYLQVTASASRSSAEAVVKTLRESGFPAVLRAGPNNLTAVWVGPYTDRKPLAEAKTKLEKAGFKDMIVKKP